MVYPIGRYTIRPFMLLWVKRINGLDNLKKDYPYIIVCNHASFFDDLLVPSIVVSIKHRYIHMYVNSSYFKNFFLRKFLEWGRSIPVDVKKNEGSDKKNRRAFELALEFLKRGDLVGIFPEGHRSKNGMLQEARLGAAKLALSAKVPVIPIGIIGSHKILPKGSVIPKLRRCTLSIGKPIFFKEYYGKHHDKKVLIEVTTKIMKEIAKLINQEYRFNKDGLSYH